MSKEDLLKDLEELAAALKANAERAKAHADNAHSDYSRGIYDSGAMADESSADLLLDIITKYTISQG